MTTDIQNVFKNGNITSVVRRLKDQTILRFADVPFLITSGISHVRRCRVTLDHHSQVQTGNEARSWLKVLLSSTFQTH